MVENKGHPGYRSKALATGRSKEELLKDVVHEVPEPCLFPVPKLTGLYLAPSMST